MKKIVRILRTLRTAFWTHLAVQRAIVVPKGKVRVNNRSKFNGNTYLETNTNFNGMKIYGKGKVTIGKNFHSGSECVLLTQNHNYDKGSKIPYDDTYNYKEIVVGDNVWIGNKVLILGGVEIGEGAVVQAGSVVSSSIPRCAVVGGNPARVFKYRDIEHYEKLKKEKAFN